MVLGSPFPNYGGLYLSLGTPNRRQLRSEAFQAALCRLPHAASRTRSITEGYSRKSLGSTTRLGTIHRCKLASHSSMRRHIATDSAS
jgi:hypothetical protein